MKFIFDTNARVEFEADTDQFDTALAYFEDALKNAESRGLRITVDDYSPTEVKK